MMRNTNLRAVCALLTLAAACVVFGGAGISYSPVTQGPDSTKAWPANKPDSTKAWPANKPDSTKAWPANKPDSTKAWPANKPDSTKGWPTSSISFGASPPTDTLRAWCDTTGTFWVYCTAANHWLTPVPNAFVLTGTAVTGSLGIWANAAPGDTTRATPFGFMLGADSLCCTYVGWTYRKNTAPNCSLQVFVSTTAPVKKTTQPTASGVSGLTVITPAFSGPGEPWSVYITPNSASPVNPDKPQVRLGLYRIKAKTP